MKSFFALSIVIALFTGCSSQNAFSKFNMSKDEELSASSLQNSKIKLDKEIKGTVSVIYLNEVYPEIYTQNEYFFVYVFLKDKTKMHNPNSLDKIKLTLKLNKQLPVKVKQLPAENKFSHLVNKNNQWNKYYLVAFKEQKVSTLNLVLENYPFSSAELKYQKD